MALLPRRTFSTSLSWGKKKRVRELTEHFFPLISNLFSLGAGLLRSRLLALIFTLVSGSELIIVGGWGFLQEQLIKLPRCGQTAMNLRSSPGDYNKDGCAYLKDDFSYAVFQNFHCFWKNKNRRKQPHCALSKVSSPTTYWQEPFWPWKTWDHDIVCDQLAPTAFVTEQNWKKWSACIKKTTQPWMWKKEFTKRQKSWKVSHLSMLYHSDDPQWLKSLCIGSTTALLHFCGSSSSDL